MILRTKLTCVSVLALGLCISCASASFAAIESLFFPGELNLLSDNSAEFLLSREATPNSTLDVGDILVAVFNIETLENLGGPGENDLGTSGNPELTGLSVIQVATKVAGSGPGQFDFTFTPVVGDASAIAFLTANVPSIATAVSSWSAGTMIGTYVDSTPDYTRIGADVAPGPSGDVGDPTLQAQEEALAAFSFNSDTGSTFVELGFAALAGTNPFWVANDAFDDLAFTRNVLPLGTPGGQVGFGLNVTQNNSNLSLGLVGTFNPVTLTGGAAQSAGLGSILGVAGGLTPFDAFDNIDVTINVQSIVPEPTSVVAWGGLLMLSLIAGGSRRRPC